MTEISISQIQAYFSTLHRCLQDVLVTNLSGQEIALEDAFSHFAVEARGAHNLGNKLMIVGNGGSAAIASHVAIDYSKNGNLRTTAFNDGAALTCLGNDLGYENVFSKQIEIHGRSGDVLIAISSSGRSPNIHRAVAAAKIIGCFVITLSGFSSSNPLRRMGDLNFYVSSDAYGFVELSHLTLCHAMLDLSVTQTSAS